MTKSIGSAEDQKPKLSMMPFWFMWLFFNASLHVNGWWNSWTWCIMQSGGCWLTFVLFATQCHIKQDGCVHSHHVENRHAFVAASFKPAPMIIWHCSILSAVFLNWSFLHLHLTTYCDMGCKSWFTTWVVGI
jgi:hypothetical protein